MSRRGRSSRFPSRATGSDLATSGGFRQTKPSNAPVNVAVERSRQPSPSNLGAPRGSAIIKTTGRDGVMVELREPLDALITPPSTFTAATAFPRAREIRLYDTTLRDGEQTPGVAFTPGQKYEL